MSTDTKMGIFFIVAIFNVFFNIFVRQLHKKNEPGEQYWLTLLWSFGWWFCYTALIVIFIINKFKLAKEKLSSNNKF